MFEEQVLPLVRERAGGTRAAPAHPADRRRWARATSSRWWRPSTRPSPTRAPPSWAAPAQVELHLTAEARPRGGGRGAASRRWPRRCASGCRRRSTARTAASCPRWWRRCCVERGLTLALAESCTGGMLAARLTERPGSSAFLERGVRHLHQPRQGGAARRRPRAARAAGRRLRGGRARHGGGRAPRRGRRHRRWPSPASRARRRHGGEAGGARVPRRSPAPPATACAACTSRATATRVRRQACRRRWR